MPEIPPLTVETVKNRVGTVLGSTAEKHDRAVLSQPICQRAEDCGVADQFHGGEIVRCADVVVRDVVQVAGNRRQYDVVDCVDVGQRVRDLLWLGEVQSDTARVAADLCSDRLGVRTVTASKDDGPTPFRVVTGNLSADTVRAARDQQ